MTDAAAEPTEEPKKGGKGPLLIGLVLALVGAGGGYFAVSAGLLPFGGTEEAHEEKVEHEADVVPTEDIAFIEVPGMVISFTGGGRRQLLRFSAQLEVSKAYKDDVELLLPRIVDVLNGYLRALEVSDIEDPMALTRLRAQMLRRIQIVTGRDMVRDLLIMEFVLN
ncbi:MAG: flagellar basal body protein FliL [Rhodobacteraceae bacterium]|nr:flagellar basal body protein FliL [Paracoccaceae bacterium]